VRSNQVDGAAHPTTNKPDRQLLAQIPTSIPSRRAYVLYFVTKVPNAVRSTGLTALQHPITNTGPLERREFRQMICRRYQYLGCHGDLRIFEVYIK